MTYYVRWKPGTIAEYQCFDPSTARWVACARDDVAAFLKQGVVYMNPRFHPTMELDQRKVVRA